MGKAVAVPAATLRVHGDPSTYAARSDSGSTVTRAFCGRCGTSLWAWTSMMPDGRNLSAATLDDPARFAPGMHVFASSAQPWDYLPPDSTRFDRMPPARR